MPRLVLIVAAAALPLSILLAVGIGPVSLAPDLVARILGAHLVPGQHLADWSPAEDQIVWAFRTPRTLLAALVGAGLAVAGAVLQAIIRNPLADPYVLGSSSGAGLGAVLAIVAGAAVPGVLLTGSAFAGAFAAGILVWSFARRGRTLRILPMVLAGVAFSYLFSAATSWVTVTADHGTVPGIVFFLLGSVAQARWAALALPAIVVALVLVWAVARSSALNAMLLGDETASSLGVDTGRFRLEGLAATSLVTGAVVAAAGGIGFVGMVVPHVCRMLIGGEHRRLLPLSALIGASFLVWVDVLARVAAAPRELPLGIVTAVLGAPFFLWLLRRRVRTEARP